MKRIIQLAFVAALTTSCGEKTEIENNPPKKDKTSNSTVESMAKRHIETTLGIPATEKYTYKIYKEHLDSDNKIDAIIVVNRKQFALKKASESNRTAKSAETGFLGRYNYVFYYDGGLNKISPDIVVPSSALVELKVAFENITSDAYKDIIIDYRIKGGSFYDFLTVNNHSPERIFQWKHFGNLGSADTYEAFHFEYVEGTVNPRKDILVKKSILQKPTSDVDIYTYVPTLVPTDEVLYRFFYLPEQGKYVTKMK